MLVVYGASVATPGGASDSAGGTVTIGGAVILVLLIYGGWNEAAYFSGEMRNVRRNMVRALTLGIGVVTLLYVVINYAYLRVLGLEGIRSSAAVDWNNTECRYDNESDDGSGGEHRCPFMTAVYFAVMTK